MVRLTVQFWEEKNFVMSCFVQSSELGSAKKVRRTNITDFFFSRGSKDVREMKSIKKVIPKFLSFIDDTRDGYNLLKLASNQSITNILLKVKVSTIRPSSPLRHASA